MKTFAEIYGSLKNKFLSKTNLNIEPGTIMDSFTLATSQMLEEAHKEIENNKTPYIYSKLAGDEADSMGFMLNCPRMPNESDESYKYRWLNWVKRNEASNTTAIETALMNLTYASNATHVPYTAGVGTATVYIIPKEYDDATILKALNEVQGRLSTVVSPTSYISYVIPKIIPVKLVIYINSKTGDIEAIKENLNKKIAKHVNELPVGDYLSIGALNKIGVTEPSVDYFNVVQLYLNGRETSSLNILQRIDSKLLFDEIVWWVV